MAIAWPGPGFTGPCRKSDFGRMTPDDQALYGSDTDAAVRTGPAVNHVEPEACELGDTFWSPMKRDVSRGASPA